MTINAYNRVKALLIDQRRQIIHSPKVASQLITDLGIRDILIEVPIPKTASQKKVTTKKTASRKAAGK